jgi:hypothetical protein
MQKENQRKTEVSHSYIDGNVLELLRGRNSEFLKQLFEETNPYLARVCLANGITDEDVNELIHGRRFLSTSKSLKEGLKSGLSSAEFCSTKFARIGDSKSASFPEEDSETFLNRAFTAETDYFGENHHGLSS